MLENLSTKEIVLGVIDLSTEEVETVETVKSRVKRALDHFPAERLTLAPDCGMKYISRVSAMGKLKAMTQAAAELREEVGK